MRGLLCGIGATDPTTFALAAVVMAVVAVVAVVALAASYLPARRASHVYPTEALRAD